MPSDVINLTSSACNSLLLVLRYGQKIMLEMQKFRITATQEMDCNLALILLVYQRDLLILGHF